MTRCEIDLDRFNHNIDRVGRLSGGATPMAVIKADAYGHGAAVLMRRLYSKGTRFFGVANIGEAMELRRTFHQGTILVLGYTPPKLMHYAAEYGVALTVFSYEQAEHLNAQGEKVTVHIKINTGLHRLGFWPGEQAFEEIYQICKMPNLRVEGIFTHLAQSGAEGDMKQAEVFRTVLEELSRRGVEFEYRHISDGIALTKYGNLNCNMIRPGAVYYGYGEGFKPIMKLRSKVIFVHKVPAGEGVSYGLTDAADHDRIIATLPYGYSDGVPRVLSNGVGHVTIRGQRAPYVGVLCMDMCMVDVTHISGVQEWDTVTVLGDGENEFTFTEAARLCSVNVNSLLSGVARRVPRVYFEGGKEVMFTDYLF